MLNEGSLDVKTKKKKLVVGQCILGLMRMITSINWLVRNKQESKGN